MSLSPFDQWFFAARDEENKIDGVGVPVGTTMLYKFCHNDVKAFEGACALLEQAFNAGAAGAVPAGWQPTAENVNALPEPIRRYICDIETNADPAGTVREVTQLRDQVRELAASNRMLRDRVAGVEAQGVPDGWQLVPKQPTHEMERAGWKELPWVGAASGDGGLALTRLVYAKMLASGPPAPQANEVIEQRNAQCSELFKDAERYRWLRGAAYVGVSPHTKTCLWTLRGVFELPGQGFDAAIDEAMKGGQ